MFCDSARAWLPQRQQAGLGGFVEKIRIIVFILASPTGFEPVLSP